MATAFSQREREKITQALLDAAQCRAAMGSMKTTTVESLSHEAGISKGAFYGFFDSKEHLFLSMLERIHNNMVESASRALESHMEQPIRERTRLAILEVFRVVEQSGAIGFIRDDVPLLLRRLPPEMLTAHYQSEDELIRAMVLKANVKLNTSLDTACAVVRLLMMTLLVKRDVGERFPEAVRLVIEGACDQLLA